MDKDQWKQIEEMVQQALDLPPDERTVFIEKECGNDEALLNETQSLLQHTEKAFSFISHFEKNIVAPSIDNMARNRFDETERIDTVVGHYRITEIIGRGGMGVVYKARDTSLDRTVALKFLPSHLARSKTDKKRFVHEAKAAAALNHPNICTIYAVEQHEDQYFMAMEYLDGQTLREKLESGDLTVESALEYAIHIAGALAEAHEHGIVHRDIKPGNIMVDSKNRIKVMDFGIAQLQTKSGDIKEGETAGTIRYMSPEQVAGKEVDHRTDIWSVGVVLYEMITGKHPFEGESDQAVIQSILHKNPDSLDKLQPVIPDKLNKIVVKCLEKNIQDRYEGMDEVIRDLHQINTNLLRSLEHATSLFSKHYSRKNAIGLLVVLLGLLLAGYWFFPFSGAGANPGITIAVLPLESISQNPDDIEFTDGIHEELINRLAGIGNLTVIARSSVMRYSPQERDLQTIGRELGVFSVLEGTIRRFNNQLRISVRLVDVKTQNTIWSGSFEESIDDLFEIQSRIVLQVSRELQTTLTKEEQQRLNEPPTQNQQAYLFYMRGRQYLGRSFHERNNLLAAEQFLNRAVTEDPQFAQAWGMLAYTHAFLYAGDGMPQQLEKVKKAADQAHFLAPNLPETNMALGLYLFWSDTDIERCLSYFESSLQQFPNHPILHLITAYTHRRLGNWELLFHHLKEALEHDPLNENLYIELGWNYDLIRDYEKAEEYYIKLKELFSNKTADWWISLTKFHRDGNIEILDSFFDSYTLDPAEEMPFNWGNYNMLKRNWEEALRGYNSISNEIVLSQQALYLLKSHLIAKVYYGQGNLAEARKYFEETKQHLEIQREKYPHEPRYQIALATSYAWLGEAEKAVRLGEEVLKLPIFQNSKYEHGTILTTRMSIVYMLSGHEEQAIDNLEYLLSIPSMIHRNMLKIHPDWDPLRDHPRFQELIAGEDEPYIEGL